MQEKVKKISIKNQERLAKALRANLLKRKEQQRTRSLGQEVEEKTFYKISAQEFFLNIHLIPNAHDNAIQGYHKDASGQIFLKISVRSLPHDNLANINLIDFLAEKLFIPRANISLIKGNTSCNKILCINNQFEDLEARLKNLFLVQKMEKY